MKLIDEETIKEEMKQIEPIGVIGESHLNAAQVLAEHNVIYLTTPEEQAKQRRREMVEKYGEPEKTLEEEVLETLMPESNELNDFVFGPAHRQEGEPQDWYKARLKIEKKILQMRNKRGVAAWDTSEKGQHIDETKQKAKRYRKLKSKTRIRLSRQQRKDMGLL